MSGWRAVWLALPLIRRQLVRNRRRTALTFLGLVISFFLYTSLASVLHTMESVLSDTASETGIFVRARGARSFGRAGLPASYVETLRGMDGIVAASPLRFYAGRGRYEGSFAIALGAEIDSFLRIRTLAGVTADEVERLRATRNGALVGVSVLKANDWRVGDTVTLRGAGRAPSFSFKVVGDIDGADTLSRVALVHLDALEKILGGAGRVTFIQARVRHPEIAPAVCQAIDARFANFTVPTETVAEKAHVASVLGNLAGVLSALRAIGYLTLAVTVLVVGNNVAMSIRERTVEIGTLRALGFGRSHVLCLVLGEAIGVAVAGGVVGAAAAYGAFELGLFELPRPAPFRFTSDPSVLLRAALLSVPVGALAGLQPALGAVRMRITDALRYAD